MNPENSENGLHSTGRRLVRRRLAEAVLVVAFVAALIGLSHGLAALAAWLLR